MTALSLFTFNTTLYNCPIYSEDNSLTSFTLGLSERMDISAFIYLLLRTETMKAKVMANGINILSLSCVC